MFPLAGRLSWEQPYSAVSSLASLEAYVAIITQLFNVAFHFSHNIHILCVTSQY